MDINQVYTSNSEYISHEHLQNKRIDVVIEDAQTVTLGQDQKIALSFRGKEKKLALNKTNARMIAHLLNASDTREWIGKTITLRPDMTEFNGKSVPCVRVDSILPAQDTTDSKPADGSSVDDNEIPF